MVPRVAEVIVAIAERKSTKLAALNAAVAAVREALSAYGRERSGRFIVFGSLARGEARFNSDLDLMIDFPSDGERAALAFAEEVCIRHGISPDLHLVTEATGCSRASGATELQCRERCTLGRCGRRSRHCRRSFRQGRDAARTCRAVLRPAGCLSRCNGGHARNVGSPHVCGRCAPANSRHSR